MRRSPGRIATILLCGLAVSGISAASAEACLFFHWGFGHGGCYPGTTAFYGGFGGCCPTQTFFAPSYYAPSCYNPCNPCAGVCPSGDCSVDFGTAPPADSGWQPTPADQQEPRTFEDGAAEDEAGAPDSAEPPEGGGRVENGATEALKPSTEQPETEVPQRKHAPITPPDENGQQAEPDEPPVPEDGGNGKAGSESGYDTLHVPSLGLDDKVTWRVTPRRRRMKIRSRYPTPTIARQQVSPNADWTPVPEGNRIVSK